MGAAVRRPHGIPRPPGPARITTPVAPVRALAVRWAPMGREKLDGLRGELAKIPLLIAKVRGEIQAVYGRFMAFQEEVGGHLGEFGQQLFGIHVIQEMILEKINISPEEVKARIDAREAALAAQQKHLNERAEAARAAAEVEKMRQAMAHHAGATEQPSPAEGDHAQAAQAAEALGSDQDDQQR